MTMAAAAAGAAAPVPAGGGGAGTGRGCGGRARQRRRRPMPALLVAALAAALLMGPAAAAVGGRTPHLPSLPWRGGLLGGRGGQQPQHGEKAPLGACKSTRQSGGFVAPKARREGEGGQGQWWAGLQKGLGLASSPHGGSAQRPSGPMLATVGGAASAGAQRLGEDAAALAAALVATLAGPPAALLRRLHATPLAQIGALGRRGWGRWGLWLRMPIVPHT